MATLNDQPYHPGEQWAYRVSQSARSEHVTVVGVEQVKNTLRVEIEFVDPPKQGKRERVPPGRLRVRWEGVTAYDAWMDASDRVASEKLDHTEEAAVALVIRLLMPTEVAELDYSPADYVTVVHDRAALELLIHGSLPQLLETVASIDDEGELTISPYGSALIAQALCRHNPEPVLEALIEEERQIRDTVKRGSTRKDYLENKMVDTSPEWEYARYLKWDRPRLELLRQWCGHRAVTMYERLIAAEAEVNRLGVLIAQQGDALRTHGAETLAKAFEEDHERHRITPEQTRPIIDRPLEPWETPVQYVERRRRWPR